MTLGDISVFTLAALGIGAYLLNFMWLAVMIRRSVSGLRSKLYIIAIPALILCTVVMLCITEVSRCVIGGREPSVFEQTAEQLNAAGCLIFLIVMTLIWGLLWIKQETTIMSSLTPQSLEDGLNSLPDGITFADPNGVPLLVNSTMQRVCREGLGRPMLNTLSFEDCLQKGMVAEGCRAEIRGKGYYLHLRDGSIWDIRKRLVITKGHKLWELLAYDITERYSKSRELEERSAHLKEVNLNIRNYTRELNAIIREEEVLAAKIRIHDDVGRALLALKSYLIRGGDREALIELWQFTAGLLRGENEPDDSADPIGALMEAAKAVGVELTLTGSIPPDLHKLTVIAIHECLTNTVKHADGTRLDVEITDKDGCVTEIFRNDGRPPQGEISEKGGLKSLRTAVEKERGEMELSADPQFTLTIRVNRKEQ